MLQLRHCAVPFVLAALVWSEPSAAQEEVSPDQVTVVPEKRAADTEARMSPEERVLLTYGIMPIAWGRVTEVPKEAIVGAGYVAGVPRLGVPALQETDASLGVAWSRGMRGVEGATPLPSAASMASTWNPALVRRGGQVIGADAKAKGFNVLLAGGVNLSREPRNGRNFEYFGEDPLLAGVLGGAAIDGVQSNNIISTVKHLALNAQETGRTFLDAKIMNASLRESDLLAFQIAIERGRPGAVMCAYNHINGVAGCGNDYLLNRVLKRDWRYKGFVMSDWGAVPSLDAALAGLDQQSGSQLDKELYFGDALRQAAAHDRRYAARLRDMNRRILYSIYANGLDVSPPVRKPVDFKTGLAVAEDLSRQGIVLLRNERGVLPLAASAKKIALIGGYAISGVLSGGGSSQVHLDNGPAVIVPLNGEGHFASTNGEAYHRSSPMKAIKEMAPNAQLIFRRGNYIADAVDAARRSEVAIVFATQWTSEGFDVPDLSLPGGQDALIAAVAEANPNTIVVLETGGPVLMPWLDKTAAVLEAWYPGGRGGEAIASVLFGETNPSGRLPMTFPAGLDQLPRPKLDGAELEPDFMGRAPSPDTRLSVDYEIEGSDVGYRWNARRGYRALFPFGYGLSYTQFERSGLSITGLEARFTLANTGQRAGADVGQVYLTGRPGGAKRRLVGFERVELAPGERRAVTVAIDPRLLADWNGTGWTLRGGSYRFAIGDNAEKLGPEITVTLKGRRWKD